MTPETIDAIKGALAPVAEKIGQGAEYGWAVVVKQQFVSAVGFAITAGFSFVLMLLGIFCFYLCYRLEQKHEGDAATGALMSGIFLVLIGGFGLGTAGFAALARIINPDYYALQFFIGLVK